MSGISLNSKISNNNSSSSSTVSSQGEVKLFQIVERKTKNTKIRQLKIDAKCSQAEFKKWQQKINKIKECKTKFKWILIPKEWKFNNKIFKPFATILFQGYQASLVDKIQKRRQSDNYFSQTQMGNLLEQLFLALKQIQSAKNQNKNTINPQQQKENCQPLEDLIGFFQLRSILINFKNQIAILTNFSICQKEIQKNKNIQEENSNKKIQNSSSSSNYLKKISIILLQCSDLEWQDLVEYKTQIYQDLLYKFQLNTRYSTIFKFFVLNNLKEQQIQQTDQKRSSININLNNLLQKYLKKKQLSSEVFSNNQIDFIRKQVQKLDNQLKKLQKSRILSIIPQKSQSDLRKYQILILQNQMKILFIQDQSIKKSACSIAVKVGSFEQPQRSPGLAHFLQHMLFMGSHEFPKQNQYDEYIVLNGGYTNAQTGNDLTKYYFQVSNQAFQGAVTRLVSFFTGTLLDQQCIKKEIQAVNEEYMINVSSQQYNKQIIMRQFMLPPYNRFTMGNRASLSKQWIRTDLVDFYNKWYSSNIMTATIYSHDPIQHLKQKFVPIFQKIKNKRLKYPQYGIGFDKQKFKKMIKTPTDRGITLQFRFIVKCIKTQYKKHIDDYICHVLGHQGQNSLFEELKSRQLIFNLEASSAHMSQQTLISLEMDVVKDQNNQVEQIYSIVMSYIKQMKPEKRIYDQLKTISHLAFKYFDKGFPADQVQALSELMHYVPLKQILTFNYLYDQFDENMINQTIKQLNQDNLLLLYQSQFLNVEKSFKQKYLYSSFKTIQQFQNINKYKVQKLPEIKKQYLDLEKIKFNLIQLNQYLPVSEVIFELKNQIQTQKKTSNFIKIPNYLKESPQIIGKPQQCIAFARDTYFKTCKGQIILQVYSEQTYAFKYFLGYFIKDILKHSESDFIYDAELLDTIINFDFQYTFKINIFGFNDVSLKVLNQIGENLMRNVDQAIFRNSYQYILDYCNSTDSMEPEQIANIMLDTIIFKSQMTFYQISKEFQKYQFNKIKPRIRDFWQKSKFMWYFIGNFDKDQVKNTVQKFNKNVGNTNESSFKKTVQNRCLMLEKNIKYIYAYEENTVVNSSALIYYEVGPYFQNIYHTLLLLSKFLEQPYNNQLRTQKQLAYSLSIQICQKQNILGLIFNLTSSKIDPIQIAIQIKTFLKNSLQKMKCIIDIDGDQQNNQNTQNTQKNQKQCFLNDQKILKLKNSIISEISSPFTNFGQLTSFVYDQIRFGSYNFNRRTKEFIQDQMKKIQTKDLYQLLKKISQKSIQVLVLSKRDQQKFAQSLKKLPQKQQNEFFQIQEIRSQFNYFQDFNINRIKNIDLFIKRQKLQ